MAESRAILLLQRELYLLEKTPPWGVSVSLIRNSLLEWSVQLEAFENSIWAGGVFNLELRFDENFDSKPPRVQFMTVPFHPNIDMDSGVPCSNFLTSSWQGYAGCVGTLLVFLQQLLHEPVLDDCINPTAAAIYSTSPRLYHQLAQDCVVASRRIASGLEPFSSSNSLVPVASSVNLTSLEVPRPLPVSFEDYHSIWSKSGTSRSEYQKKDFVKNYYNFTSGIGGRDLEYTKELLRLVERQKQLWYGKFAFPKDYGTHNSQTHANQRMREASRKLHAKEDKLAKLRRMYGIEARDVNELDFEKKMKTPHASTDVLNENPQELELMQPPVAFLDSSMLPNVESDTFIALANNFPKNAAIFSGNHESIRGKSRSSVSDKQHSPLIGRTLQNKQFISQFSDDVQSSPMLQRHKAKDPEAFYNTNAKYQEHHSNGVRLNADIRAGNSESILSDFAEKSQSFSAQYYSQVQNPANGFTSLPVHPFPLAADLDDIADDFSNDGDEDLVKWSQNLNLST